MTGLLVYTNNFLKLWHNKFTMVVKAVENGCISFSFDSFIFITIIYFLEGHLLSTSEP